MVRCLGDGADCDCSSCGGYGSWGATVFDVRAINRAGRRVGGEMNALWHELSVLCFIIWVGERFVAKPWDASIKG